MYEPSGHTSPPPAESVPIKHAGFDFDDTFWPQKYASQQLFEALYDKVAEVTGQPRDAVVAEALRVVRTTMVHEMPDYVDQMANGDSPVAKALTANLDEVKDHMAVVEGQYVQAVQGAVEAVKMLQEEGVETFVFSEANGETLSQRLKLMGFDGVIERAYSAMVPFATEKGPEEPLEFEPATPRDPDARMEHTELLASNSLSPKDGQDKGWRITLDLEGVDERDYDKTIIVGDNPVRDIAPAKELGVIAVRADATLILDDRPDYNATDPNQFRGHRPIETREAAKPDVILNTLADLVANFRGPNADPKLHDPKARLAAFKARVDAAIEAGPAPKGQITIAVEGRDTPRGPYYRAA